VSHDPSEVMHADNTFLIIINVGNVFRIFYTEHICVYVYMYISYMYMSHICG